MVVSGRTIKARSQIMIMLLRQEQYEDLSSGIMTWSSYRNQLIEGRCFMNVLNEHAGKYAFA
jgi:hypothetical protein